MTVLVESSRHLKTSFKMETENFNVLEEKEEVRDIIECPYKKFKFDHDNFNEDASFVTSNEIPQAMDTSNGDCVGIRPDNPQAPALDVQVEMLEGEAEIEAEGDSENGESMHARFVIVCNNRRFQGQDLTMGQTQMTTTKKLNLCWTKHFPMS